jgi:twitching motility protein PilT
MITLQQLLKATIKQNASDLHIVAGSAPVLRVEGQIIRFKSETLTAEQTQNLCYSILTESQKSRFEATKELDFSFGIKDLARFRVNIFQQKGAISGVFRRIPIEIPDIDKLGIPQAIRELINYPSGLVLVTGPTGSGKSTTLAAMIDRLNKDLRGHIMTLEDPIEYIFPHRSCIVNQREVGVDSVSYKSALKHILRQDPDVCFMGELRDLETIEAALNVAETGHLVFSTLHTNSAVGTINRMVNVFPADQQDRIRTQIALSLNAVVSQRLLPAIDGGLIPAFEVMILNPSLRNLIRENKLHQVYGMMQTGQDKTGMTTMNQSLLKLVLARKIEVRAAFLNSVDPEELDKMMKTAGV